MKVSRLLIVAALTASCSHETSDRSDYKANETAQTVAATGGTSDQAPPAAQPPDAKKPVATPIADQAKAVGADPNAAVDQSFKARIDAYMKLRKEAVKDAPRLKETNDPAKIKAAQDAMSVQIRAARADAKQGDLLAPEIVAKFRRQLNPELKGDDGRDAKAVIKDDAPTNIPFKVNAKYPEGASVPTVPASLLVNLPTLPEPLQFRIIEKHLVLVDEDADVILDYALNIIR